MEKIYKKQHNIKKRFMRLIIVVLLLFSFNSLFAQGGRHQAVERLRYSMSPYIDTSVQRGIALKSDYVKNFNYYQRAFIYSIFTNLDYGSKVTRYQESDEKKDMINNFRFDIGGLLGFHLITNIQSRLYFLGGVGYSDYSYTDTADIYSDVSWNGLSSIYVSGLEIRPFWLKDYYFFIEFMSKRIFIASSGEPEADNPKSHNINNDRFYFGVGTNFNLKSKLRRWAR